MKKVYFEIGGKKMVTNVNGKTDIEAIENVKNKIIFHKIINKEEESFEQLFKEMLGITK